MSKIYLLSRDLDLQSRFEANCMRNWYLFTFKFQFEIATDRPTTYGRILNTVLPNVKIKTVWGAVIDISAYIRIDISSMMCLYLNALN